MAAKTIPWEILNDYVVRCGNVHEPYRFCVEVLEGLYDLIDFDEGLFLMLDGNRKIARKYFSNISLRWSSIYLEYYSRMSEHGFGLQGDAYEQEDGTFVRSIEWDEFDWINDDFMTNYIRKRGLKHSLTFVLFDLKGSPATAFSLDRLRPDIFSREDEHVLRLICAHINNLYKNFFVRPKGQVRIWDGKLGAEDLTAREREVCDLLCQGVTPANISRELHISLGTTNKHIGHIYKKLGVDSRQELLVRLLGK